MNPFESRNSQNVIFKGNPVLIPTFTNAFDLGEDNDHRDQPPEQQEQGGTQSENEEVAQHYTEARHLSSEQDHIDQLAHDRQVDHVEDRI